MATNIRIFFTKSLFALIAIQIINMSIHGGDYGKNIFLQQQDYIGSFNQIDCLGEFIYETVLEQRSNFLFPDHDLHNHSKGPAKLLKFVDIKLPVEPLVFKEPVAMVSDEKPYESLPQTYDFLFYNEITPPPPKLA